MHRGSQSYPLVSSSLSPFVPLSIRPFVPSSLRPSYSFQNVLVKIVNTVIISSLPIIINRLRTTLPVSGILEKLLNGPALPNPGPIPAIQVAAELEAVTGSTPVITIMIVPITNTKRYKTTNERIDILVFSGTLFPLSLMNDIDLG